MSWAAQLNPQQKHPMAQAVGGLNPRSIKIELSPPMMLIQIFLSLILSKAFPACLPKGSRPHGTPVLAECHVLKSIATPACMPGTPVALNPALCLMWSPGQGGLEFDNVIFLSTEQKVGKPKRNLRKDINHSHAHDLQSHERHHPLIYLQQFPLRHDSLDIVGR
jgi:hypothetical protein